MVAMHMIEPIAVIDCFTSGLGAVEILTGGNARFILYVDQTNAEGEIEHVIVQKTVMHVDVVPDAIAMTWAALGVAFVQRVTRLARHFH